MPQPAPNAISKRWEDARSTCRARTPFLFFEYVLGPSGTTAALKGATGSPGLTTSGVCMTAQIDKFIYSPRLTTTSPHLTENVPLFDHLKGGYKLTSPRPRPTARINQGRSSQKSRIVAIVCPRRNLGTATLSNLYRRSKDISSSLET